MKEKKIVKDIEKFVLDTLSSNKSEGLRWNTHVPMKVDIAFIMNALSNSQVLAGKGVAFLEHGTYKDQRVIRIYFP